MLSVDCERFFRQRWTQKFSARYFTETGLFHRGFMDLRRNTVKGEVLCDFCIFLAACSLPSEPDGASSHLEYKIFPSFSEDIEHCLFVGERSSQGPPLSLTLNRECGKFIGCFFPTIIKQSLAKGCRLTTYSRHDQAQRCLPSDLEHRHIV